MLNKIRIIHLTDYDFQGGSAYYAYRISEFMNSNLNINSKMFVLYKKSNDKNVIKFEFKKNSKFWKKFYFFFLKKKNKYSFYNYGKYVINEVSQVSKIIDYKPNFIIIYNNSNFLSPKIINYLSKKKISIIFYLTDMEIVTGGCHYNFECINFHSKCNDCPAFNIFFKDMPEKNLLEKKLAYQDLDLTFFTPNKSIGESVKKSTFFNKSKHKIINFYLSFDMNKYSPIKKKNNVKKIFSIRSSLNIRKGQKYFIQSLDYLKKLEPNFENKFQINIVGDSSLIKVLKKKKIPFKFFENVNSEEKLINFYRESDFFINQSIQDNGPSMLSEALCCGIPVISFDNGAAKDLIINKFNGFLIKTKSSEDLAKAIKYSLSISDKELDTMKKNSREIAQKNLDLRKNINNFIVSID